MSPTAEDLNRARAASRAAWRVGKSGLDLQLLDRAIAATGRRTDLRRPTAPNALSEYVLFATNRRFTNSADAENGFDTVAGNLRFGDVSVELASTPSPSDDTNNKLKVSIKSLLPDDVAFVTVLQSALNTARNRQVLVLVHGFNNSFGDAARRAALFSANIKFPGVMVFFSWPSANNPFRYVHDLNSVSNTKADFRRFVSVLTRALPQGQTSLIAHSLGSRVIYDYLDFAQAAGQGAKFQHLALAAPDIEADQFARYGNVIVPQGITFTAERPRALCLRDGGRPTEAWPRRTLGYHHSSRYGVG